MSFFSFVFFGVTFTLLFGSFFVFFVGLGLAIFLELEAPLLFVLACVFAFAMVLELNTGGRAGYLRATANPGGILPVAPARPHINTE